MKPEYILQKDITNLNFKTERVREVKVMSWGKDILISKFFIYTSIKVQKDEVRGQYRQMVKLRLASHV